MLEILELETPEHYYQKLQDRPEVKDRYREFTQGIRRSTSSSSYKDNPPTPRKSSLKQSFEDKKDESNVAKGKATSRNKKRKTQKRRMK